MEKIYTPILKILILLLLFLSGMPRLAAQNQGVISLNEETRIRGTGYDAYGAFVDFTITYYDDLESDSWIEEGKLYCNVDGGEDVLITSFGSEKVDTDGDQDPVPLEIQVNEGYLRAAAWEDDLPDPNHLSSWSFGNVNVYISKRVGRNARAYIRWYVPNKYVGKDLKFRYWRDIYDSDGFDRIESGDYTNLGLQSYAVAPLTIPAFSRKFSDTAGKFAIAYNYAPANKYPVRITFDGQVKDAVDTEEAPSGTFHISTSGTGRTIDFTTAALTKALFPGSYAANYQETRPITVPAYIWPGSLDAVNIGGNVVTLSWTVPVPENENFITGGNFEIQRSTDETFGTNVKTVGTVPYDAGALSYTIEDNLSDISGGTRIYYRLRRTNSSAEWGWRETRNASLDVKIMTSLTAGTAVLDETDGPRAIISWEPFRGVWVNGTKFILKKANSTTGETTHISLTEEEARSGKYIDESIQYCKAFSYSIQLTYGNGYPSPEEAKVAGNVLAVNIGTISDLEVSKGYFTDRVEMSWQTAGGFDSYLVGRRKYGDSGSFIQINSVPATAATKTVRVTDNDGAPGTYYEYSVTGTVSCGDSIRYSRDTLYAIGFRNPTGNIYGRITYENGQAVQNAEVRLENEDEERLGRSVYLNGDPGSYLEVDSLITPFADSAFTVEAWIRPADTAPVNQVIFSREGQYELGFDGTGQLYFSYNGKRLSGAYLNTNGSFMHVAGIHSADTLRLMLNGSRIAETVHPFVAAANPAANVLMGRNEAGNPFIGYLDEVRAWNRALDTATVGLGYTRLLAGGENGLVAYWRFDETITDQFFDLSHRDGQYNRNDGKMKSRHVQRTEVIPTPEQLSLKAYTDSTGNYMITGVPYFGNGSTYSIVPRLGTHQFDPILERRLISADNPSFTVNFVDKSSFPVSGYVYYLDGTVPVEGVQFQVDGVYAQKDNGELIQTDVNGKFTVSVPVGTHEVRAVKSNHVFVNQGKITDRFGENLNYQGPVSERILRDSTTIRFIGRVAGGALQESRPLGHSVSRNNLGREISITISLPTGTKYDLHSGSSDTTVWVAHPAHPGDDPDQGHRTRVVYHRNKIVIYPDSVTGEFFANLIPEKFNADNVSVTGWGNLLNEEVLALDFTNKFMEQFSVHSYIDSTAADSVFYNDSYQFIKRVTPSMSVVQVSTSGDDLKWFGDEAYNAVYGNGEEIAIPVANGNKTGRAMYLLGYPVFRQGTEYNLRINAFEEYPFYASVRSDGTPVIATKNGEEISDRVPTSDGYVSVLNTFRSGGTSTDTLSLDSMGTGYYTLRAGDPATTAPGLKSLSVSIRFGQATDLNWNWLGQPKLEGFVMGAKMTGTDFITAGPDKLLAVLRDPPGSRSYSFIEAGSTYRSGSTYKTSVDQAGNIDTYVLLGAKVITFFGLGGGVIKEVSDSENETGVGVVHEEHYNYSNTKETSTTITSRFQTSDAPVFVGGPGDVYIGHSTNITYGQTQNAIIIRRADLKAADSVLHDPGASTDYLVVMREGINFGEQFGTLFAYPQQHIIKVLIPNLEHIRNSLLLPPGTNGQALANSSGKPVYVSKLDAADPDFGKSNDDTETFGERSEDMGFNEGESYTIYFPEDMDYRTDTIMVLNQYIKGWEQRIEDNEKQKIETRNPENRSFHAGSPFTYSEQFSETKTKSNSFNIIVAAKVLHESSFKIAGQGFKLKVDESLGTSQGGDFETSQDSTTTIGYTLASDGTDDYISVDITRPEDGGFVFRTLGGATACPYEGEEVTQYYKPRTVINHATQRIEVPEMTVDEAVVNDVPASQKASYTLRIKNESEARLPTTLMLSYIDTDSIKGATISVDGLPIGGTGRPIPVQYGETVTKVITLTKGPDAMDYENIPIILKSSCQYEPTGYQETIADTVLISAHFVPACGNVNIKSPTNQWLLNTEAPVNENKKRYLPLIIDQFDLSNNLFDRIELQYKPASSATWIVRMKFYGDSATYKAAEGSKRMITNAREILYNLEMDDASFNDQGYDIRAVSICKLGPADFINTPSNVISGLKDTYAPRLFGSPQPANEVLGISDEIRLNFNETIAAGLLTYSDFQVRGIRNGSMGDHSVSVVLDGAGDYLATEFDRNLAEKNITIELWCLPAGQSAGTLVSHGDANQSLELALTADNYLEAIIGGRAVKSEQPVSVLPGEWAHVALVYDAVTASLSACYNFVEVIHNIPVEAYTGNGPFEFGRSISKAGNYFKGKMHEARIWDAALTGLQLQTNSLRILSGSENGLLAYYPMNEGKGDLVSDKAHSSNARLLGEWSTPPGKAVAFSGNGLLKIKTGSIPITDEMDYTMALWFKGDAGQSDAALASNGRGEGDELGGSHDLFFLGFESGRLTFRNNNFKIQVEGNYLDDAWHQVAFAVNRTSGTAQLFVDGELRTFFDARNLGGIAAPFIYLGARGWRNANDAANVHFDRYFSGEIDEFRLWNTYLSQTLISAGSNTRLNGTELGLLAYYPFETWFEHQNNQELGFTPNDMKIPADPMTGAPTAELINAAETADKAPIKSRGPVENLQFDFVVNNDALIITLLEPRQAIDKTIVTFQVKDARDLNGNALQSPVTWSAYIDRNQLHWADPEFNLTKDLDAGLEFESYIVNNGGSVQHFTLDNLPAWLQASPSSGTVDPQGRLRIRFEVHEGLNIGSYNEIVYMRNDNNESEALPVTLTVKGEEPPWEVNPADFKYSMTVYGKLQMNGTFSADENDMLAAFRNGVCVGVTRNSYNRKNDLWYSLLSIYSNEADGGELEFRIWDASTGSTYLAVPSLPVTFRNDAISGTSRNPVIFSGEEMQFQELDLQEGWNWISLNVFNQQLDQVGATLSNGKWNPGDLVKNAEMGFHQYSSGSGWVGTMDGFNNTGLFQLKSSASQTLSVSGTPVDPATTAISVKADSWNYISYLPQVSMTLEEALAGYAALQDDVIKSQTGFAMYDSQNGWMGNLTHLEPGKGYMLYRAAGAPVSFFYPALGGSLINAAGRLAGLVGPAAAGGAAGYGEVAGPVLKSSASSTPNPNSLELPVENNYCFSENMTVVAKLDESFQLQPDDRVLAYAGGELRGEAGAISLPGIREPRFFLNIGGDKEQPVHFEVERAGRVVARSGTIITYQSNGLTGSLRAPLIIITENEAGKITVFPNPFGKEAHVRLEIAKKEQRANYLVQLSVYDVDGTKIFEGPEESTASGTYLTSWNGRNLQGIACSPGVYFIRVTIDHLPLIQKVVKIDSYK